MSNISQLAGTPEISFIENMTLQETENMVREQYTRIFQEKFGTTPELGDADPIALLIKTFSLIIYQVMQYIDAKGRAELLKTATGEFLDALVALLGITRKEATRATATVRFSLAEARTEVTAIPAGTRVKTQGGRYFNTITYAQIEAGETYVDITVQAEETGTGSSGIAVGGIDTLVDPIPYIAKVSNIDESTGGMDVEDDDSLTERAYLAPSKFSCAGPKDAYEYYVREWRSDIADVQIVSPSPCVIQIFVVLDDEEQGKRLPTKAERESLELFINGETIRPLCDMVVCVEPEEIEYEINLTYWIGKSDQKSVGTIQERIADAVESYKLWQRSLGRDINPTEIIARIREAGAKRVRLTSPGDLTVSETQLPKCVTTNVAYGGVEND